MKVSMIDESTLGFGKGCTIQFQRTMRVPTTSEYQYRTNFDTDALQTFDNFPFIKVSNFANKLPEQWVKQNGILLPMHLFEGCKLSIEGKNSFTCYLLIEIAGVNTPVALSLQVDETTDGITGHQWNDNLVSSPKPNYSSKVLL
jgi:hypothetical protein